MSTTNFVLRYREPGGTFAVAALELPTGTSLEAATEIAVEEGQAQGLLLERITDTATGEVGQHRPIAPASRGFGK